MDFQRLEFVTVRTVRRVSVHHCAKFRVDRSNRCRDIAIFRFFQSGGSPLRCICYVHVWITRDEYLTVFITITGQLADTPTRGLDISRTGQVAVSQTPPKERKLSTQCRRWHPRVDQSARCPVRESSSPRVGNPRVGVSAVVHFITVQNLVGIDSV